MKKDIVNLSKEEYEYLKSIDLNSYHGLINYLLVILKTFLEITIKLILVVIKHQVMKNVH